MRSPTAAFAWELWHKHCSRLIAIVGVFLGFALFYSPLCARVGFDPASSNSLANFVPKYLQIGVGGSMLLRIGKALFCLFLLTGPLIAMFLSLLCVTWMFIMFEFDPTGKSTAAIPSRVFTLPISTAFLFCWLFFGGLATIVVLFECWVHFVQMPYLDVFGEYQDCIGWMAFLALAQGTTWSLDGWPITRLMALMALLFCFLYYPAWHDLLRSLPVLPFLFVAGTALAGVGLRKMRHGQWRGFPPRTRVVTALESGELRGPRRFSSVAQAQLWFEWRRFARTLVFFAFTLTIVPAVIHLLARVAFGNRPLDGNTLLVFEMVLLCMPVIVHALGAASPGRAGHDFLMNRPVTTGEMTLAFLKAAGISTVLSWILVFIALGAIPLLGGFTWAERNIFVPSKYQGAVVIGLIVLTWRAFTANLCFSRSGIRWLADLPVLILVGTCGAGVPIVIGLQTNSGFRDAVLEYAPFTPALLIFLVAVKLLLAFAGFRASVNRRLLSPSAVLGYVVFWIVLVLALVALVLTLPLPSREWTLPLSLCVVLLAPLARISFCPISIAHSRHG